MTAWRTSRRSHFDWRSRHGVATIRFDAAGAQEPAHLRQLRRAARHVPRASPAPTTSRRWCSRRTAATSARAATCTTSSARCSTRDMKGLLAFTRHDRRSGQGDARLPAAGDRGGRRRLRRRRRDDRAGRRHPPRHAGGARRHSCSRGSGWPAATWAPARCCRASSARAERRSCSTPGARMSAEEGERWGFFNRLRRSRRAGSRGARRWRAGSPTGRASRT